MTTTKKDPEVVNTKKKPEVVNTKKDPEVVTTKKRSGSGQHEKGTGNDLWPLTFDPWPLTFDLTYKIGVLNYCSSLDHPHNLFIF